MLLHPREAEVSEGAAGRDGETDVDVVRHEDEHQHEADPQLDKVESCLNDVAHFDDRVTSLPPTAAARFPNNNYPIAEGTRRAKIK